MMSDEQGGREKNRIQGVKRTERSSVKNTVIFSWNIVLNSVWTYVSARSGDSQDSGEKGDRIFSGRGDRGGNVESTAVTKGSCQTSPIE